MNAHVNALPRSPAELNPEIPLDLAAVILRALEKKPSDRFQTAGEFGAGLESVSLAHGRQPGTSPDAADTIVAASNSTAPEIAAPSTPTPSGGRPLRNTPPSGSATSTPVSFDEAKLETMRRELSRHVGPMARVLVDRAARKATNWKQLYEALAPELPEGAERERFLASRPRSVS
jgi:serine/threonine-protein kinase